MEEAWGEREDWDDTRGKGAGQPPSPFSHPKSCLASVIMAFLSLKVSFSANRLELTLERGSHSVLLPTPLKLPQRTPPLGRFSFSSEEVLKKGLPLVLNGEDAARRLEFIK